MPCRVPDQAHPHRCDKLVKQGKGSVTGMDHVWPKQGLLLISRCETYCQFCFEAKGTTGKWKYPWYLRRHVQNIHAGRTHPGLKCGQGWEGSQGGNNKPWRAQGVPAPMGNRANGTKTPTGSRRRKPKQQTEKTQRTKYREAKKSGPEGTYSRDITPADSCNNITDSDDDTDISMLGTPSRQPTMADNFNLTPSTAASANSFSTADGAGTAFKTDADAIAAMPGYPSFGSSDSGLFEDTFGHGEASNDINTKFGQLFEQSPKIEFDGRMSGLELAPSTMTSGHTSSLMVTTAPMTHLGMGSRRVAEQIVRTDGSLIEPELDTPIGEGADNLTYALNDAMFDRIVNDEMTPPQALRLLHSYARRFMFGQR